MNQLLNASADRPKLAGALPFLKELGKAGSGIPAFRAANPIPKTYISSITHQLN